jgi:hypothetical protein
VDFIDKPPSVPRSENNTGKTHSSPHPPSADTSSRVPSSKGRAETNGPLVMPRARKTVGDRKPGKPSAADEKGIITV